MEATIAGTALKVSRCRSVAMSHRWTRPSIPPTASVELSGLTASLKSWIDGSWGAAWKVAPNPSRPVRSHSSTVSSKLPVKSVDPSLLTIASWTVAAWPASVCVIRPVATSQLEHLPVNDPARERGLAVRRERDRPTAPVWAPIPVLTTPVWRSRKRTDPSLSPNAAVSPSRLAAAESTSLEVGERVEQAASSSVEHVGLRAEADQLPPVRHIVEGGRSRGADHRADDPSPRVGELDDGSL